LLQLIPHLFKASVNPPRSTSSTFRHENTTSRMLSQEPAAQLSATTAGESITIKYSSPSVRGRQIFGDVSRQQKQFG
jgi:hypothetical protein